MRCPLCGSPAEELFSSLACDKRGFANGPSARDRDAIIADVRRQLHALWGFSDFAIVVNERSRHLEFDSWGTYRNIHARVGEEKFAAAKPIADAAILELFGGEP